MQIPQTKKRLHKQSLTRRILYDNNIQHIHKNYEVSQFPQQFNQFNSNSTIKKGYYPKHTGCFQSYVDLVNRNRNLLRRGPCEIPIKQIAQSSQYIKEDNKTEIKSKNTIQGRPRVWKSTCLKQKTQNTNRTNNLPRWIGSITPKSKYRKHSVNEIIESDKQKHKKIGRDINTSKQDIEKMSGCQRWKKSEQISMGNAINKLLGIEQIKYRLLSKNSTSRIVTEPLY